MKIYAYPKCYLNDAMTTLAVLLDYAVNYRNAQPDAFFREFIDGGFARRFEQGNPDIVAGHSGVELYGLITGEDVYLSKYQAIDKSPEFWLGWSLAYAQWEMNRTFHEITAVVSLSEMLAWYPTLHEADLMRFVEAVEQRLHERRTNLEAFRKAAGLSQEQLSMLSGVSVRSIRSYERRENDLAKAQFNILDALAKTLCRSVYELMDSNTAPI